MAMMIVKTVLRMREILGVTVGCALSRQRRTCGAWKMQVTVIISCFAAGSYKTIALAVRSGVRFYLPCDGRYSVGRKGQQTQLIF